jgi:Flp pilus assembly protein TadG
MMLKSNLANQDRRGAILVLAALLMVVLIGMVAFSVDYAYLLKLRTDLQRSADAAALAAVQDLIRLPNGTQDLNKARETAVTFVRNNLDDQSFQVASGDIQIGRYDPTSIYSKVTLLDTGTFDTVRVTLRKDGATNAKAPLFFARVLGVEDATITVTATAILQKAEFLQPGAQVLPFATPLDLWNSLEPGDRWSVYGDGKLKDEYGNNVPGNWGTMDIGNANNSTSDLNDQILNGLRQSDLDALHADGRIPQKTYIDSSVPAWMESDTGLSSGLKHSVEAVHGQQKVVPIYDTLVNSKGSHVDFHVVKWGVVKVIDSKWKGSKDTYVIVEKSQLFDGKLRPNSNLSATGGYIDGAYTAPALVE